MLVTLLATLSIAIPSPMVRLSVEGNGYLQFAEDGHALYTSSAPLVVMNGWLSNPNGAPLLPTLRVPDGTVKVDVDQDGDVFAATRHYRGLVGRISLATFRQGADLRQSGSFLISSERPTYEQPGSGDAGTLRILTPGESAPETIAPAVQPDVAVSVTDDFVQSWLNRRPNEIGDAPHDVPSGFAHIVVASESDIDTDNVSLGDIAVIDAGDQLRQALSTARIGDTPKAGKKEDVKVETIERHLESLGFDTSKFQIDIPRHAFLTRHGQRLSEDAITNAAIEAAEKVCGERDLKASVHIDSDYAPLGELSYEVESCTSTPRGAVVIVVTKVDGERYKSHVVRVSTGG